MWLHGKGKKDRLILEPGRDHPQQIVPGLLRHKAQPGLLQAQLGLISNRFATVQATIDLYQALGGGSLIPE